MKITIEDGCLKAVAESIRPNLWRVLLCEGDTEFLYLVRKKARVRELLAYWLPGYERTVKAVIPVKPRMTAKPLTAVTRPTSEGETDHLLKG